MLAKPRALRLAPGVMVSEEKIVSRAVVEVMMNAFLVMEEA